MNVLPSMTTAMPLVVYKLQSICDKPKIFRMLPFPHSTPKNYVYLVGQTLNNKHLCVSYSVGLKSMIDVCDCHFCTVIQYYMIGHIKSQFEPKTENMWWPYHTHMHTRLIDSLIFQIVPV